MINLSKFGETLSELLQERGISVKKLAEETGIRKSNIYYYMRGERLPSVQSVVALADFFGCSVDFLLGLEEINASETYKECPSFSERIEFLLEYFGISTYKVYTQANISKARFFDWKRGKHEPALDNIIRLAEVFDCSVDFVLGRV